MTRKWKDADMESGHERRGQHAAAWCGQLALPALQLAVLSWELSVDLRVQVVRAREGGEGRKDLETEDRRDGGTESMEAERREGRRDGWREEMEGSE